MRQRLIEAVERIEKTLNEYAAGGRNTEALTIIQRAIFDIRCEASDHEGVRDKLGSLAGWVDKLYSARKHQSWGGVDMVKQHARGACSGLRKYVNELTATRTME